MISGSKFQHNKQILLQALLLSQIILMLSSKGTKAKVRSKNIERSENLETTPDPWEGFDNTTLDTLQHAKQPWIVSSEHPIVPYWIIYIENYAGIDEALKKYATDITGLNLTNLEGNWMGSWAAFNINGSDPPYSRIRYPAIEYKRRIQVPAFEYIEITYFLHGQAYILVNTTTGPNHLINISSSDGTDEWITKTFSLQGHRFDSVELRATDQYEGVAIIDTISLWEKLPPPTTPGYTFNQRTTTDMSSDTSDLESSS